MKTARIGLSLIPVLIIGWVCAGSATAGSWSADALAAALDTPARPDADKSRDAARRPAEVLAFIGVEPGMTVLDVMASRGWYTEVLSIAVGEQGTVYSQNSLSALERRDGANDKALTARLAGDRLPNVVRADGEISEIEPGSIDLAFTALNFHDTYNFLGAEAAAALLADIYAVLKPGGVFGFIDHAGNPDQNNTRLHRIPKQIVMEIAADSGFIIEAESDVLAHPEDDRTEMVFGKIRGKTDRFLLKLRKPDQSAGNGFLPQSEYALQLHRPNILVSDMDRALRVYRDILGFQVNFLLDSMGVAYDIFALDPQAKLRMAFISEGRGAFGSLALTEATGVDLPERALPYASAIIIELAEGRLAGVVEQLKGEGLEVGMPHELDKPPRTDISFTDHDGHRVVLFEIHRGGKG